MEFKEIAQNVYACMQKDKGFGWNNSGFINLGDGLVVDTHYDLPTTQKQIDLIASVTDKKPRYLVNTHHNGDHVWGNQLYKDAEIIAHKLCAEEVQKEKDSKIVGLFQGLQAAGPENVPEEIRWFFKDVSEFDYNGIDITVPNKLIEGRLDLDLGGFPCEIVYVGPAHTSNDLIVHLPEHRVVFASDILFWKCTPVGWDGTHEQWMKAIDQIVFLKPGIIVPGHGPLCGVNELLELKAYFEFVYEESKKLFDSGETIPLEAAKRIDLGKYMEWTQPERLIWTVARAFRDFRGEAWDESFGDAMSLLALGHQLKQFWER
ncbi:MBL fold metallo-hydrolase [bacterium]|nr:MBL fold metallo-hydrolase [bacterium]